MMNHIKRSSLIRQVVTIVCMLTISITTVYAEDDMLVDLADSDDLEAFHAESGVTIWKENDKKEVSTYGDKPKQAAQPSNNGGIVEENLGGATANTTQSTTAQASAQHGRAAGATETFERGQELRAREAYKTGNHPALRDIPSLYEAVEMLHEQLNRYCPGGWEKKDEWHLPNNNHHFIHYRAICL